MPADGRTMAEIEVRCERESSSKDLPGVGRIGALQSRRDQPTHLDPGCAPTQDARRSS